jgi:hypothetical protein
MSRLKEIKNEIAKEHDYKSYSDMIEHFEVPEYMVEKVAKRYANECMANALQLGSFSANMKYHDGRTKEDSEIKYFQNGADNLIVNRESITNPENIILL